MAKSVRAPKPVPRNTIEEKIDRIVILLDELVRETRLHNHPLTITHGHVGGSGNFVSPVPIPWNV